MIWQDAVVLVAQLVCLVSLIPTLMDRESWPPIATTLPTGAALTAMATAFITLELYLSAVLVYGLSAAWLYMTFRT
jgi:hypothetical protein